MKKLVMLVAMYLLLLNFNVEAAAIATPSSNGATSSDVSVNKNATDSQENKNSNLKISINLAARSLAVYEGNKKIRLYPIGPGKVSTPTPTGYYKVQYMEKNPSWVSPHDGTVIPSGPDCPLGYRWIGFNGSYGIHGTNRPESVGGYVSDGCVRMHEKEVEALYDLVAVNTPVEITYNRVVVEKLDDNTVAYYIYPDGYGWQKLTTGDVDKWLAGFGVNNFESDTAIAEKIENSDGNPTYVAKVYPLYLQDKKLKKAAVYQNDKMFLPVDTIAAESGIDYSYNANNNTIDTRYGRASGVLKKDTLYIEAGSTAAIFNLVGKFDSKKNYVLSTPVSTPAAEKVNPSETSAEPQKQEVANTAKPEIVATKASDDWITAKNAKN